MDRRILKRIFHFSMMILFATFLTLYVSRQAGYMEYQNHQKVALTEKQIKKFEEDVSKGKQIDIEDYLKTTDKDYQNSISRLGLKISNASKNIVNKTVDGSFKIISKLTE